MIILYKFEINVEINLIDDNLVSVSENTFLQRPTFSKFKISRCHNHFYGNYF